jgi:hypothetical protein
MPRIASASNGASAMKAIHNLCSATLAALLSAELVMGVSAGAWAQGAPAAPPAAVPAMAPLPPTSHLLAARDVVLISGLSGTFSNIYNDFIVNMRQNLVTRPEVTKDLEATLAALKPEADRRVEDMIAAASVVFARGMTEAELKEVSTFFNSPVGRKYNQSRPQMINEVYQQLQPWTYRTSDFFYQFTRTEMKKRGHDIGG